MIVVGTARIVFQSSVRLSVCPIWLPHATAAGLLLLVRSAGDIDRMLQQRWAYVGSATLLAYVGRLVSVGSSPITAKNIAYLITLTMLSPSLVLLQYMI